MLGCGDVGGAPFLAYNSLRSSDGALWGYSQLGGFIDVNSRGLTLMASYFILTLNWTIILYEISQLLHSMQRIIFRWAKQLYLAFV